MKIKKLFSRVSFIFGPHFVRAFTVIFACAFSLLSFTGCTKSSKSGDKITLVTSCYPVHIILMNLVKDVENIEIKRMSESHSGCLHNFQLQSEDLKNIELSSAFIINGAGMETFLDKVVNENPKITIIDSSSGIELIHECESHEHECDHDDCHHSCHHEINPHIWLSPENYIRQIQNISEGLKKLDPENSKKYDENAEIYVEKIINLKNKMHSELDEIPKKDIITFHNAFPYFAKEFGLNIIGVINHEAGEEPSAKEILEIVDTINENNICAVFTEPQYSCGTTETIAKETGAKVYTLDPAVTGELNENSYIATMEENAKTLKLALC